MQNYQKTLHLNPRMHRLHIEWMEACDFTKYAPLVAKSWQFPTGFTVVVTPYDPGEDEYVAYAAVLYDENSNMLDMSTPHEDFLGKYVVKDPYTQDTYTLILDDNCKGWISPNTKGYVCNTFNLPVFYAFYYSGDNKFCMPKTVVQKLNLLLKTPTSICFSGNSDNTEETKTLWQENIVIDSTGYRYLRISIEANRAEYYPYVQIQLLYYVDDNVDAVEQVAYHMASEDYPSANILGDYEFTKVKEDSKEPFHFQIGIAE
jgi:hypothetical protein